MNIEASHRSDYCGFCSLVVDSMMLAGIPITDGFSSLSPWDNLIKDLTVAQASPAGERHLCAADAGLPRERH